MAKYLLDTHVLLWWLDNKSPLSPAARHTIDDGDNEVTVSVASIWEIGIKTALNKFKAPEDLLAILGLHRINILPIHANHAFAVRSLPHLHDDPFDRMLVVQAMIEDLTLMTHDKTLREYGVPCLMV